MRKPETVIANTKSSDAVRLKLSASIPNTVGATIPPSPQQAVIVPAILDEFAGSKFPASPIINGQIGAKQNPINAYPIRSAFLDVIRITIKINAADPI